MGKFVESLKNNTKVFDAFLEKLNLDSTTTVKEMVENGEVYKDEGLINILSGRLNELKSEHQAQVEQLNIRTKELIAAEKNKSFKTVESKNSSYAMEVSNALKFIEIEGSSINDDKAFLILKDFMDDHQKMHLFKNVIEKQLDPMDKEGINNFKKTFGKFNEKESLLKTFELMESIADNLFIKPLTKQNASILRGQEFISKYSPSYLELADPMELLDLAEIIENLTSEE